ncbi:unnamed protein product [Schistosoma rodhaini]|nr:unnamed protein product [Schistosoma rodhaini]
MTDSTNKICRYFNTIEGCWYKDYCKFLHIPNKKPPCKFYDLSTGCRYGEMCHFSHDRTSLKLIESYNVDYSMELIKGLLKKNMTSKELNGTNNNNNNIIQSILNNKEQKTVESTSDLIQDKNHTNVISNHDPSNRNVSINLHENTTEVEDPSPSNAKNLITINQTNYSVSSLCPVSNDDHSINANSTLNDLCTNKASTNQPVTSTVIGHSKDLSNENEIVCGSCNQILVRHQNESYCTLLKNHYLDHFLDKGGDHVKYVNIRAELEPRQMFWCKSCILLFKKPWSLFQHMVDKAKGKKIQHLEKQSHFDWLDNIAGLMAGYDLGLFNPRKLKVDLRNLLTDQHTIDEELETEAATTIGIMQWLNPFINPWRLQQFELMRKIKQFNRQLLRRVNPSLKTGYTGYSKSAALPPARVPLSTTSCQTNETYFDNLDSLTSTDTSTPTLDDFGLCLKNSLPLETFNQGCPSESTSSVSIELDTCVVSSEENNKEESDEWNKPSNYQLFYIDDKDHSLCKPLVEKQMETEMLTTGASGDVTTTTSGINPKITPDIKHELDRIIEIIDSNNTNRAYIMSLLNRSNASGYHRKQSKCVPICSNDSSICKSKISNICTTMNSKHLKEPFRYQLLGRNSKAFTFNHNAIYNIQRNLNRIYHKINQTPYYGINNFDLLNFFSTNLDFNFNLIDENIEEILSQWKKPLI